jgi:glyoxylase-like metal-dependent hydrolase (beta-lactamase superfamily II)
MTDSTPASPYAFELGEIRCRVVSDGTAPYDPGFVFANADPDELSGALAGRLDAQGLLATPYHCLLLETPDALVLVDTGLGGLAAAADAPAGRLLRSLEATGHTPDDVDVVLLSHAHPDHIGGLLDGGRLTFSRARHVMSRTEWEFWTDPDSLGRLPEFLAAPARALLPPLRAADQVELTDGESEVVPGLWLRPAPGHTPGHCVVTVSAGGGQTTFLADALLDALDFAHPDWVSAVDHDPGETERTRRRLLDEAADGGGQVLAYHMSGIGNVERDGGAYAFVPD